METGNIYQDGVVLILETSCWGARKKLPQDRINVSADPKFVSGTKRLVDHERYLQPIRRNQQQAADRIRDRWAVPGFPLNGASFIPKANIETVESALQKYLGRHEELVEEFLPLYPRMKEEARIELEPDGLYEDEEYPRDVRSRFGFAWKYVILEAPDAGANVMTAPMLAREKEKIGVMIEEFRANAVAILRTEFAQVVANLAECLKSGNKRRIRQESLDSLEDWMERFERLNINNDRELTGFVETMRGLVAGTDARELRNNDLFRRTISNEMAEVSVTLASLAEETPRRRIVPVNPDSMNAAQAPQPLVSAGAPAAMYSDPSPAP